MADATIGTGSITIGGQPSFSDLEQSKLDLKRRIAELNASRQPQPEPSPVVESAPQLNTTADIASELQRLQPLVNQEKEQAASDATSRRIAELEAILSQQRSEFNRPALPVGINVSPYGPGIGVGQFVPSIPTSRDKASQLSKMLEISTQIDKLKAQQTTQKPFETKAATPAATESKQEEAAQPQAQPQPEQVPTEDFSYFNNLMARRNQTRAKAIDYIKNKLPSNQWLDAMKLVDDYSKQYFKVPENIAQPVLDPTTMQPLQGYAIIDGKVEKIEAGGGKSSQSVIGYEGQTPTEKEAIEFRRYLSEINPAISGLEELITLGNVGNRMSPTQRSRSSGLARFVQGKLREEILGPGTVTEPDRKILEEVVKDPLQIFTVVDNVATLKDLLDRVNASKQARESTLGLKRIGQQKSQAQGAAGGYFFNPKTGKVEPK